MIAPAGHLGAGAQAGDWAAPGATRGQIRIQFLAEAIVLSLAGGVVGVAAGLLPAIRAARLSPTQALWSL